MSYVYCFFLYLPAINIPVVVLVPRIIREFLVSFLSILPSNLLCVISALKVNLLFLFGFTTIYGIYHKGDSSNQPFIEALSVRNHNYNILKYYVSLLGLIVFTIIFFKEFKLSRFPFELRRKNAWLDYPYSICLNSRRYI